MGFDGGRADGIFGARTDAALRAFQRQIGLRSDGWCGPQTLRALDQLRPRARDGNPHELRESEALRRRGPGLAGKSVVVDPGHGGDDAGWVVGDLIERDLVYDVATRLQGRLQATGATAELTRGPGGSPTDGARAALANATEADLLLSLHCDGADSSLPHGIASYYYGTGRGNGSVVGGRLAGLVQREVSARLPGVLDARAHAKTWELLRATRMPAVRVELGYLTHPDDAARLADPAARDTFAEALLVAIQRLFLPVELDPPTGTMRLADLAASLYP
jgi:N-acetylmuramoyl-L-alanine amidase